MLESPLEDRIGHATGLATTAEEVLTEWIGGYYYGTVSEETVKADVEDCLAHLEESGFKIVRKD